MITDTAKTSTTMKNGDVKMLIRNLRKMKEQETEKQALDLANVVLSSIERMTDEELAEEQRVLSAEIEAATQRLSSVENELFYRKHPECRRH